MALSILRQALSQWSLLDSNNVKEFLRQELVPLVREMRVAFNKFASGPYDYGTIMSGTGAPVDPPSAQRAIYIDLAGGALTTLYVWNGAAWEAK